MQSSGEAVVNLTVGNRAPPIIGANLSGRFYSHDAQAGRPLALVALGVLEPDHLAAALDRLQACRAALARGGVDLVILLPFSARYAAAVSDHAAADLVIHINDGSGLDRLQQDGRPGLAVLDRGWRLVHVGAFGPETDLAALCAFLAPQLASEAGRLCTASAPVLIVPNVLAPDACRALIAHFEASPHRPGVMASMQGDAAVAKLDESKKKRRDLELTAETPLHAEIVRVLAERLAPEIKRAFQFDVAFADRILLARYDDTGGYFRRHRDNAAAHTAFRDFAVSINLNTPDYEGGELLFPEYNDHRHSPPAGGALVFSASILHEAAPVTRGQRYVALSFLSGPTAQARLSQAA